MGDIFTDAEKSARRAEEQAMPKTKKTTTVTTITRTWVEYTRKDLFDALGVPRDAQLHLVNERGNLEVCHEGPDDTVLAVRHETTNEERH